MKTGYDFTYIFINKNFFDFTESSTSPSSYVCILKDNICEKQCDKYIKAGKIPEKIRINNFK